MLVILYSFLNLLNLTSLLFSPVLSVMTPQLNIDLGHILDILCHVIINQLCYSKFDLLIHNLNGNRENEKFT